jgi:UDP-3-O-[3-hydroxymyristoyl] glucosamine N-acyltransferase
VKIVGEANIGNNVIIRENTVIGADGLTTDRDENGKAMTMPQFGGVVIEDDVNIGANSVIARGAIDNTIIHRGSKIDNCVFISHNVQIGSDTFVVGESIMFGSASTGERVLISGNTTIGNYVHIGDDTILGQNSSAIKSIPNGKLAYGNPAKAIRDR